MEKSIESKVCKNESERKEESWGCGGTRVQGKIMFYCVSIQLISLDCFEWDSIINFKTTTASLLFSVYFRIKAPDLPQGKLFF